MSDPFERSDRQSTLPQPELNPLVNPLLGENMSRWAEVYFRNPPEHREKAVFELLQQLKAEKSGREGQPVEDHAAAGKEETGDAVAPQAIPSLDARTEDEPHILSCQSCGNHNGNDQRFCGACGAPLGHGPANEDMPRVHAQGGSPEFSTLDREREPEETFSRLPVDSYPWRRDDTIHLHGYEDDHPHSYRAYLGTALLLVLLALGYMAWRNAQTKTATPLATQAPPPSEPVQPQNQTTAENRSDQSTGEAGRGSVAKDLPARDDRPPEKPAAPEPRNVEAKPSQENVNPAALIAKEPANSSAVTSGSEEFALAQNYLNGTGGREHNTQEAVDWLWKAIGKRNTAATLLLSDLYLRGNQIPKNCDQARVLLDAAASRGVGEAAVRLRNMRAFGCE